MLHSRQASIWPSTGVILLTTSCPCSVLLSHINACSDERHKGEEAQEGGRAPARL